MRLDRIATNLAFMSFQHSLNSGGLECTNNTSCMQATDYKYFDHSCIQCPRVCSVVLPWAPPPNEIHHTKTIHCNGANLNNIVMMYQSFWAVCSGVRDLDKPEMFLIIYHSKRSGYYRDNSSHLIRGKRPILEFCTVVQHIGGSANVVAALECRCACFRST